MPEATKKGTMLMCAALETFWKATGTTDTPMSQVLTFMHVGSRAEVSMAELEKLTGVVQSSVSRNVAKIGPGLNPKEPGLGLVEAYEDPWNRKRKLVRLTKKGLQLQADLEKQLGRYLK